MMMVEATTRKLCNGAYRNFVGRKECWRVAVIVLVLGTVASCWLLVSIGRVSHSEELNAMIRILFARNCRQWFVPIKEKLLLDPSHRKDGFLLLYLEEFNLTDPTDRTTLLTGARVLR